MLRSWQPAKRFDQGALIDSNSAYIAAKLEENGAAVTRHTCVGDDLDLLIAAFKEIGSRADIAVVTGGWGRHPMILPQRPLPRQGGVTLDLNPSALQSVENYFKARKRDDERCQPETDLAAGRRGMLAEPDWDRPRISPANRQMPFFLSSGRTG